MRDALRLRAAALDLLGGGPPDRTRLAGCSAASWRVFLRTERCALALKARLGGGAHAAIDAAATRELQRVLSARGHLVRIGRLAAAHDMPAIVLKGGVAALTSAAPVDLHDVDVLVRPDAAPRLALLLEGEGFHATGPGGMVHLAQQVTPNAVHIEVHFALADVELTDAMWRRARPLNGASGGGLSRLGAADHVWHLLVHSVVTHPHRRGALRDVLLLAQALRDCTPAELADVERRGAGHRLARVLGDQLAMARELAAGGPVRDRFRREAAANYLLRGPLGWLGFSRFWSPALTGALFTQLAGAAERRHEWRLAWTRPDFPSPWAWVARLEPRAPRLVGLCRNAVKVMRLIVCRGVAWPVAVAARRLASPRLRSPHPLSPSPFGRGGTTHER